jgi:hypothetical protein
LRGIVYPTIVALLLSGTLGAAAIFMIAGYGGDGAGGPLRPEQGVAMALQAMATVIAISLALLLMVRHSLVRVPAARSRPVHVALGWGVAGALALHALVTVVGGSRGGGIPVSFYVIDCLALTGIAIQLGSGHLQGRWRTARLALVHAWLSVPLALVIAELGIVAVTEAGVSMRFC